MKILKNETYKDLLDQIKKGDNQQQDYSKKIRYYKAEISNLKELNENLKYDNEVIHSQNIVYYDEINKKDSQIGRLISDNVKIAKQVKCFSGSKGGLIKERNKLLREIEILKLDLAKAYEKIGNLSHIIKSSHIQLSINEYDKRLKSTKNVRSK